MAIEKIKIVGAILELPTKQHCQFSQVQLQEWTEHSTLIFKNLKPVEISKNIFNIERYAIERTAFALKVYIECDEAFYKIKFA